MGGIYSARKVRDELAPRIADELKKARIDAFYLVPALTPCVISPWD